MLFKDTFIAPKNRLTRSSPPHNIQYNCINPTMSYTVETTSLNAVSYVVTVIGIRDLTRIKQTVSTTVNRRFVSRSIDTEHRPHRWIRFLWTNICLEYQRRVERERERGREERTVEGEFFRLLD